MKAEKIVQIDGIKLTKIAQMTFDFQKKSSSTNYLALPWFVDFVDADINAPTKLF